MCNLKCLTVQNEVIITSFCIIYTFGNNYKYCLVFSEEINVLKL